MKTSQATVKIKEIKRYYVTKLIFILFICFTILFLIGFFYITPLYLSVGWGKFFLNNLSLLYVNNSKIQLIITIALSIVLFLIFIILYLVFYYINNSYYQKEYLDAIFKELKLNEIYLLGKRVTQDNFAFENILCSIGLEQMEKEYLFSLQSILSMSIYQIYHSLHHNSKKGLLIYVKVDKKIDGFIQLSLDNKIPIVEYDNKGIYQYVFDNLKKYPSPIFCNSSYNKKTYEIINEDVLDTFNHLRKFTKNKNIVTYRNNEFFVYIPNWELRLTDSLRKKVYGDTLDKKIEALTQLVDDITDIYIYLSKNIKEDN